MVCSKNKSKLTRITCILYALKVYCEQLLLPCPRLQCDIASLLGELKQCCPHVHSLFHETYCKDDTFILHFYLVFFDHFVGLMHIF